MGFPGSMQLLGAILSPERLLQPYIVLHLNTSAVHWADQSSIGHVSVSMQHFSNLCLCIGVHACIQDE
jgi:hypothetical protein